MRALDSGTRLTAKEAPGRWRQEAVSLHTATLRRPRARQAPPGHSGPAISTIEAPAPRRTPSRRTPAFPRPRAGHHPAPQSFPGSSSPGLDPSAAPPPPQLPTSVPVSLGGVGPQTPKGEDPKIQELIERPRHAETVVVEADVGVVRVAHAGTQDRGVESPAAAAMHT